MAVTAKYRAKHATVHTEGGKAGNKDKFPIGDKKHAELAIDFENRAKPPLSGEQRKDVERRAAAYGVGPAASKPRAKPTGAKRAK